MNAPHMPPSVRFPRIVLTFLGLWLVGVSFAGRPAVAGAACYTPPTSPTGFWKGDGDTTDSTGSNPATLSGGAGYAAGQSGQAFDLDGVDDFVFVPDDPSLDVGTGDFTADLWVNFDDISGEQILLEKWVQGSPITGWTLTKRSSNGIQFATNFGSANSAAQTIPTGTWVHFAVRRASGAVAVFMNGSEIASASLAGNLDTTSSLKFGHRGNPTDTPGSGDTRGFYLNGRIDEVHLWVGQGLSDLEIQAIFAAGADGLCGNCGDGVIDAGETCDDGGDASGDGCSASCSIEPCYACAGEPSVCSPDDGLTCDDGLFCNGADSCSSGTCVHAGDPCVGGSECADVCNETEDACLTPASTPCTDDTDSCTADVCDGAGACAHPAIEVCGDGMQCGVEACDDSNTESGDGCDSNCTLTACGNGIRTAGEVCDDGNPTNGDGCDNNCTVSGCGNGEVGGSETCDDGNATNGDGCDNNCTVTGCGNGVPTSGESCPESETIDPNLSWDGETLDAFANDAVFAIAVVGANVYAGGQFDEIGGVSAAGVARWDGATWNALGTGVDGSVEAMVAIGGDVYVGGDFAHAGGVPAAGVAKWNGSAWEALGAGVDGEVFALATDGANLYVGGSLITAGGAPANYVARWDGASWSPLGAGVDETVFGLFVDGTDLYAVGDFEIAGGSPAARIARWNGATWSALGSGLPESTFDVAVQGSFVWATGSEFVARWNGTKWTTMFVDGSFGYRLAVDGDDVYLGGDFTAVGGVAAEQIALWNGQSWNPLGAGLNDQVTDIVVAGDDVYVSGHFSNAGNRVAGGVAIWHTPVCGDGVAAVGEQCDDGNVADGDGCDSNCTLTACGNSIATAGEECDDGGLGEGDGCDSNCTVTTCGNGVLTPSTGETCDDGNLLNGDGCEDDCGYTPIAVDADPNEVVTTDPKDMGATPAAPTQVSLVSRDGGLVAINSETETVEIGGYQFVGIPIRIEAPAASDPNKPLLITLEVDQSVIPPNIDSSQLQAVRDATPIDDCIDLVRADPEPCLASLNPVGDDWVFVVRSEHASLWQLAIRGLDKDEQKCVDTMNKSGLKVSRTVAKEVSKCLKAAAKGDEADAQACLTADVKGKVAKALAKTVSFEVKKCETAPPFGFAGATAVNTVGQQAALDIAEMVFGDDLTSVALPKSDKEGSKCQAAILKATQKLFETKVKLLLKCEKDALKGKKVALAVSGSQLAECIAAVEADPKGKISKAAAKISKALDKKCDEVNIPSVLPGACFSTASPATCVDTSTSCLYCRMFDEIGVLGADCDALDDGLTNGSCP